jgi:hypothetical protein
MAISGQVTLFPDAHGAAFATVKSMFLLTKERLRTIFVSFPT